MKESGNFKIDFVVDQAMSFLKCLCSKSSRLVLKNFFMGSFLNFLWYSIDSSEKIYRAPRTHSNTALFFSTIIDFTIVLCGLKAKRLILFMMKFNLDSKDLFRMSLAIFSCHHSSKKLHISIEFWQGIILNPWC